MPMTVTIPALDRTSPTFRTDLDTFFLTTFPAWNAEANAIQSDVTAKQGVASTAATTATAQAGISTTQADESASSAAIAAEQADLATTNGAAQVVLAAEQVAIATEKASQTGLDRAATASDRTQTGLDRAATASDRTQTGLDREATAAAVASIADGPVTSVNGKTGVVALSATDIAAAATQAEMEAGTEAGFRSMSPLRVSQSVAKLAKSKLLRSDRTSNMPIGVPDNGKLIDITSGAFTQTFDACATLGDGWFCYLQNSGTGDITLDPNASETIDGLDSFVMYPGEVRLVQCDGDELRSIVLNSFYKTFTSSGAFIKPPGYAVFGVDAISGGGGGGKGSASVKSGGGGAGGGRWIGYVNATHLSASETVTVGAGGLGATAALGAGGNGGSASLGSTIVVYGGYGAPNNGDSARGGSVYSSASGLSGAFSAGFAVSYYSPAPANAEYGGGGGAKASTTVGTGLPGGGSQYGAGGGGSGSLGSITVGGTGGASLFGVLGRSGVAGTNIAGNPGATGASLYCGGGGAGGGTNGVTGGCAGGVGGVPGGGGGGGGTDGSRLGDGGDGARGELRIWGVI